MRGIGSGPWSTAVANAMGDPLAIGPARFRHATAPEDVDTVYLGAFARSRYIAIGGYRTFPSGTVEDADFYARWRAAGGIVRVDPSLRSWYHPRETWRAMWRQYLRYGRGKAELVWVNGRLPSWRPLAPAVLVAALTVSGVVAIIGPPLPLAIVAGSWAVAVLAVALRAPSRRLRTAAAVATMHLAYGTGLWAGLLSGRPHVVTIGMEAATDEDLSRPGSTDPKREVGPSEPS